MPFNRYRTAFFTQDLQLTRSCRPVNFLFVPCYFARLGTLSLRTLSRSVGLQRVEPSRSVEFPENFPVNRGDEFAPDCVLRQSVWLFLSLGALQPKSSILGPKRRQCPAHKRLRFLRTSNRRVNSADFL